MRKLRKKIIIKRKLLQLLAIKKKLIVKFWKW